MATTAVAVTARRDGGAWTGEAAWVGDSTLWHLDDRGTWTPIAGPAADAEDDLPLGPRPGAAVADGACDWCEFRVPAARCSSCRTAWRTRCGGARRWSRRSPPGGRVRRTRSRSRPRSALPGEGTWTTGRSSGSGRGSGCGSRRGASGRSPGWLRAGSARSYRVGGYHLPGDPADLAYKEFTSDEAKQAKAAEAAVAFRAGAWRGRPGGSGLHAAWPRALVEEPRGTVTGLLMPLIPDDFFCRHGRIRRQERSRTSRWR